MCVWGGILTNRGAHGGQKCWIPLKLEFQVIVSILIWVLETELGSPGNASGHSWPRNHLLSPPPFFFLFSFSLLSSFLPHSLFFLIFIPYFFLFLLPLCWKQGLVLPSGARWSSWWLTCFLRASIHSGKECRKGSAKERRQRGGYLGSRKLLACFIQRCSLVWETQRRRLICWIPCVHGIRDEKPRKQTKPLQL